MALMSPIPTDLSSGGLKRKCLEDEEFLSMATKFMRNSSEMNNNNLINSMNGNGSIHSDGNMYNYGSNILTSLSTSISNSTAHDMVHICHYSLISFQYLMLL